MKIETLTDADRRKLDNTENYAGRAALRIIDQLTAALEAANADRAAIINEKVQALKAAESRAEALQARVAELEAELKAERDRRVEHRQMNQSLNEQVQRLDAKCYKAAAALLDAHAATHAAEAELADLRGRVKELEEECEGLREMVATALVLLAKPVKPGDVNDAREVLRGR